MQAPVIALKQKILVLLFGFLVVFLVLEFALRLAGFIYLSRQDARAKDIFGEGRYRILCLGESTTAMGGEELIPGNSRKF